MMRLQKMWREKRKECLALLVIALLAIISLCVNFKTIRKNTARMWGGTQSPRTMLIQKQEQLTELLQEELQIQRPLTALRAARAKFWLPQDGNPQYELRRKVERCAKEAGIRLKSTGTLQITKLTEGLFAYEINITSDCQLPQLLAMLEKIENERPCLFWKNLTINPDNTRSPNFLLLNGTIKIVRLENPDMAQRLWGVNP